MGGAITMRLTHLLDQLAEEAAAPPVGSPGSLWYRETYLQSQHWQATRRRAIAAEYGRCVGCKDRDARLDVHHLSYARLWRELPSDLVPLCRRCHDREHAKPPWTRRPLKQLSWKERKRRERLTTLLAVGAILTAGIGVIIYYAVALVGEIARSAAPILRRAIILLGRRRLRRRWHRRRAHVLEARWGFAYAAGESE